MDERDTIATDKGCPRCGAQIHLRVETPGTVRIADALERLLSVDLGDEMVLLATCDCSRPRTVACRGAAISPETACGDSTND